MALLEQSSKDIRTVWCIHEINQNIMNTLKKISSSAPQDIFTFDDGLYSNWLYIDDLIKLPNQKIFYISTDIVNPQHDCHASFITCSDAHKEYFQYPIKGRKNYMTWDMIRDILKEDNCFIGMHGNKHLNPRDYKGFIDKVPAYKDDIKNMLNIFAIELPDYNFYDFFQPPYNHMDPIYNSILSIELNVRGFSSNYNTFYERIDLINLVEMDAIAS